MKVDKGLKEKIWTRRERYKNRNLVANLTHLRKEAKGTKTLKEKLYKVHHHMLETGKLFSHPIS